MEEEEIKELIQRIKWSIPMLEEYNCMDSTSWDKQEGVMITGNEAKYILGLLEWKLGGIKFANRIMEILSGSAETHGGILSLIDEEE